MRQFLHLMILLTIAWSGVAHAADPAKGRSLYAKHCASCHGDKGQGVRGEYSDPLTGDRTLKTLTQYIDKQMPEDKPKDCSGQDAVEVATYIYGAFYSEAAQIRNNPPHVEPARLTHRQYEHAIADLLASFRNPNGESSKHNLTLNFYKNRNPGGKPVRTEIVTEVKLELGNESPHPSIVVKEEDKDKKEIGPDYSIRWSGSVYAPATGDYQFTVITTNGMRLYVNDDDKPLIDVWVRSGSDQEHQGTVRLIGGQIYPLRWRRPRKNESNPSKSPWIGRRRIALANRCPHMPCAKTIHSRPLW